MKRLINGLGRQQLQKLYDELLESGENSELADYIGKRLEQIEETNQDFTNFSSSRMVEHTVEDEKRCLEMMNGFNICDFSFLISSASNKANKIGLFLPWVREDAPRIVTLGDLDRYFLDEKCISNYEGFYNTLNYIKNRFYSVGSDSLFQDFDKKKEVCKLKLGEISKYLLDIKSGTKLKLSIGDRGLVRSANGTYSRLHSYQDTMIDAFAFGSDLDKLESGNYEDCKRLLFLPRNVRNK